jgi:hypothetical protein
MAVLTTLNQIVLLKQCDVLCCKYESVNINKFYPKIKILTYEFIIYFRKSYQPHVYKKFIVSEF